MISANFDKGLLNKLHLFEGNELGRTSSTNTGTTVSNNLVGQGEFTKVMANHFGLNERRKDGHDDKNSKRKEINTSNQVSWRFTLISTWLKTLPLWIPTTPPIISGTTIMLRRWVLMTAGLSSPVASALDLRIRLIKAIGLRLRPRIMRRRARQWTSSTN